MKKMYYKPQVVFENFMLSTNIAGNCESIVDAPSKGTCAMVGTGGVAVFSNSIEACDYTPPDMGQEKEDEYDGFCYHVPTEYSNLFNS